MGDHVHMLISIPPKYAVAQVVGFIKSKSAIHIARTYGGHKKNFTVLTIGYYFLTAISLFWKIDGRVPRSLLTVQTIRARKTPLGKALP
jgi:hypothetical protein